MKTRAITAVFFTIVMLGSIFLGGIAFTGFYFLLSLAALLEFYKMVKISGVKPQRIIGVLAAASIFIATASIHFFPFDLKYLSIIVLLVFAVFIAELYEKNKAPFSNISHTLIGIIYVTVPFCFFYSLGFLTDFNNYNYHFPLAFLLMLWASDTGAFLSGGKFGKHKLFERHSPKKTWEGFFGGMFTSLLVAFAISYQFTDVPPLVWAGMAVLITSFGTLGDLVESMLKRSMDVKDSGTFLPGHGGFLDRFDGLLVAAPIIFIYLYLVIH